MGEIKLTETELGKFNFKDKLLCYVVSSKNTLKSINIQLLPLFTRVISILIPMNIYCNRSKYNG